MPRFDDFEHERRFREAWEAIKIVRPVTYSLFTFGSSVLPYYLVCDPIEKRPVSIRQGEVHVERPRIIRPGDDRPEFHNFFEDAQEEGIVQFLMTRTAHFKNLSFDNRRGAERVTDDSPEVAISKLNRKLDNEEEDRVAILRAPVNLAGVAVVRYAAERVMESAPGNIQELRERGFLP